MTLATQVDPTIIINSPTELRRCPMVIFISGLFDNKGAEIIEKHGHSCPVRGDVSFEVKEDLIGPTFPI
jgi:hypothetical protein